MRKIQHCWLLHGEQDHHRGLCKLPALKVGFEEAELFQVKGGEKYGESEGFKRRYSGGE